MRVTKITLLILSIICLFNYNCNAQGSTCSTATLISSKGTTRTDYSFQPGQTVAWFTFPAAATTMNVQIVQAVSAIDTPFVHIDSLILYSGNCKIHSMISFSTAASANNDTMPDLDLSGLVAGQQYFLKATCHANANKSSFGLYQTTYSAPIIPSCSLPMCGPNLVTNGDFETLPSWTSGGHYQDSSDILSSIAPTAPQNAYPVSSPNMRYSPNFGSVTSTCYAYGYDFTDIYTIGTSMGSSYSFNNAAQSGTHFMGIDCPSDHCMVCSSTAVFHCNSALVTPNYTCTVWQQTIPVTPGLTYTFTAWIENMDIYTGAHPAYVTMQINGAAPFFQDGITGTTYAQWAKVCYNWTAPAGVTTAKIQIMGQGAPAEGGRDFSLDNISFGLAAIPSISLNSATICSGTGGIALTASPVIAGATYTWSTGVTTSTNSITVNPSITTTYSVTASVGSCTQPATTTITVHPSPAATVTSTLVCPSTVNGTATITPSGGTTPYSFYWANGGQTTASISTSVTGTYTVIATDANNCSVTKSILVNTATPPAISVTPGGSICAGTSVTLHVIGAPYYQWSTGATTNSITVNPTTTTTYTVNGSNSSNGFCPKTQMSVVTVNPVPPVCTTNTVVLCPGQCKYLNSECNGTALTNVTYSWAPASGVTGSTNLYSAQVCPHVNTIYTVTITDNTTLCSATGTTDVEMFSGFSILGPASVTCGSVVTYSISPVLPGASYVWTTSIPGNPNGGSGPTMTVTVNSPGGVVEWGITNPGECFGKVAKIMTCYSGSVPNQAPASGIIGLTNASVYPNPAGEKLNVQVDLQPNQQVNMCMYNNLGQVITCENIQENISTISTSRLAAGIYFYRITDTDGNLIKADKIMILH